MRLLPYRCRIRAQQPSDRGSHLAAVVVGSSGGRYLSPFTLHCHHRRRIEGREVSDRYLAADNKVLPESVDWRTKESRERGCGGYSTPRPTIMDNAVGISTPDFSTRTG
ncbi:hypothetical protein E2562_036396 [Oryza meyeriana var. granulata]|uniref:Uncharacterized protein n=1 Tax=Oryza meyeriana var. granulata TaxID=110450 RepID=A0A6G1CXA9_9ORYZ|nr:hypothetical protein E2562_036396 [Oryza meyeriana var. granulata]